MQKFINKYPEFCSISLLIILCLIFLFFGIDFYPILDNYESLYAVVAKNLSVQDDLKVLILNMQPFLDKPPLYFWIISNSIKLMETFNEFSIRLPNAVMSTLLVFFTYYFGKRTMSRRFGLICAIILLTSLAFLIFSHIAILNISLTSFITFALFCGFLTSCSDTKYKKFYWWAFYLFCALAVLIKGILGLLIPLITMIIYYAYLRKLKEVFKPINLIIGLLIFIPITVPWYYEMVKLFGITFLQKHFFLPDLKLFFKNFGYYWILFFGAFMPWIFIFLGYISDGTKKFILRIKNNAQLNAITIEQKISLFGFIAFAVSFLTISFLSPIGIPTLILLLIPPATILTSYFLCAKDINESFRNKTIAISTHILAIIFTVSTISFAFIYMFLPLNIFEQVQQFKNFLIIGINFLSILLLLRVKNKNIFSTIASYVFSMFFIIIFTIVHVFNMFYFSGEDELVRFSQYTTSKNSNLITFNISVKPSVLLNATEYVYFINTPDIKNLNKILESKNKNINFIIFKNKDVPKYMPYLATKLFLIDCGNKYSIYSSIELPKKSVSISKFYSNN